MQTPQLSRGIFTISLDFELIWGTLDKPKHRHFRRLCAIEREEVVDRLLALLGQYGVSASWCTVGQLFLRDEHDAGARMPAGGDPRIFFGRDLIEKIRDCAVPQEIGSHSFTHRIFNDPRCTRAVADQELSECVRVAEEMGLRMTSFVFPRNRIAHVDLLAKHGFTAYRGQDPHWYERTAKRRWYHRAGHLLDIFCATSPGVALPVWHEEGIWEIPGSMLFTPSHGIRRVVPARARVRRAVRGLHAAADSKKIFHLWFHPTDVVVRKDAMLEAFRRVLEVASELRERGRIEILPMSGVAELMNQQPQPVRALEEVLCR